MDKITYLRFNGQEFTNFISFVKSMGSRDKSKVSKSTVLHIENGKLVCRAIDDQKSTIECNIECYNMSDNGEYHTSENDITEPIAASISDLAVLIKSASSDKFTIRKHFGQYEFNVIGGGWMPFKSSDADLTKYCIEGTEQDIGTINSVKLRNAISSVLGYTQEYTYARDRYIQFSKSQMVVTSRLSSVVTSDEFVDMTIHRDDAMMLKNLLKDNFDLRISRITDKAGDRLSFTGPNFRFTVIESEIAPNSIEYKDSLTDYIKVDCDELCKLVTFSEEYSASKHVIGLAIKNSKLNVSIKNVLAAKHCSEIESTVVGALQDTAGEAEVPSHNLLKALKLFQDKRSRYVNIYMSNKSNSSIIIFDDNTQAVINISNR